ncbi:hypothetical protein C823_003048 [Eubacterium plexicaudatum ASF492]|uniref:Glycosyltransferase RgtA/B/C/D-like domain-containing protein n=1 Tax=Eubacterium plexicaudatum ASF492 TaxID=1235802 RepID=N2AMF6_9FIRM|nr:hypothetical protein C823_003048 [Eubacterium plexicaudatum ASF492]
MSERKKYWMCYLVYAVLWLFFHALCVRVMDDVGPFAPATLEKFINSRTEWSSRMAIVILGLPFSRRPIMLWGLVDTVVMLFLAGLLDHRFNQSKRAEKTVFIMSAVCIFPFSIMSTAGWIATTHTYLWIVPAGLYVILTIKKIGEMQKISVKQYLLSGLSFLIAMDVEVGVVAMFIILLGYSALQIWNRRKNVYVYILTVVSLLRIIFDVFWQGNATRYQSDTLNYFPDHSMLDTFDKVVLGFSTSAYTIYKVYWIPLLLLTLMICFIVFENHEDLFGRIVVIISAAVAGIYPLAGFVSEQFGSLYDVALGYNAKYGLVSFSNYTKLNGYLLLLIWGMGLFCTTYGIFIIRREIKNAFIWIVYLIAGFASQFIMGFSATVYLSANRTASWLFFAILICLIGIYMEWNPKHAKMKSMITYLAAISGGISFINSLLFAANCR